MRGEVFEPSGGSNIVESALNAGRTRPTPRWVTPSRAPCASSPLHPIAAAGEAVADKCVEPGLAHPNRRRRKGSSAAVGGGPVTSPIRVDSRCSLA